MMPNRIRIPRSSPSPNPPPARLRPRSDWHVECRAVPIEMHLYAFVPSSSLLQALGLQLFLTLLSMFVVSSVAADVRAVGQALSS